MDGKTKYKSKEKAVNHLKAQFKKAGKDNISQALFCFDTDNIGIMPTWASSKL